MIFVGKERFEYETYAEVYIVLEEDGTEVSLHIHFVKMIEISVFEPNFTRQGDQIKLILVAINS